AGWIELDSEVAPIDATLRNITNNPYDLDIVEMDSAQIPRSLADLDYAVIPGSIVYSAGIAAEESLLSEDILQEYELVATVKEANKDSDWAQAVVAAYHSEAFKELLAEENQTGYWFIPEELQ
ncbi:MetQ/NlpA family ABC transporter substrate-binding protein, partial [Enterococcus innesii]